MPKPLSNLCFRIFPPSFVFVGYGDVLKDSPDIGIVELIALSPAAVFGSEFSLLFSSFASPVCATGIMYTDNEPPSDFRGCDTFHCHADRLAGPCAVLSFGRFGEKFTET